MFVSLWVLGLMAALVILAGAVVLRRLRWVRNGARVFKAVAEGASDGLVLMKQDSRIIWANDAYCRTMGYPLRELLGCYPLEFALPPDIAPTREEARSFRFDPKEERFGRLTQMRNIRKNGEEFMHEFSHAHISGGEEMRFLLVARDVTERVEREEALLAAQAHLKRLSERDALTGLSNRLHLHQKLDAFLDLGEPFAVLQIDMDDFKGINDTHGHNAGDAVLKQVAGAMTVCVGASAVAARSGGDEFTILVPGTSSLEEALNCARRLFQAVQIPLDWNAGEIIPKISVGVAVWDGRNKDADDLLNRSDVALYEAKTRCGDNVAGYDAAMHRRYAEDQVMRDEVSAAVRDSKIAFHFQPIVDVSSGLLLRFEMLARWDHPDRGILSPATFLPVIDRLGLMETFDQHVVASAVMALARLDHAGLGDIGIAINLSSDATASETIPNALLWRVDAAGVDPRRIAIEILESTAFSLADEDVTTKQLARLKSKGFQLLLDDFGMGYAGLAHLASLDVHGFKIDRRLSAAVTTDPTSLCIVEALIDMSNRLGLVVVAEGVEDAEQIACIMGAGCKKKFPRLRRIRAVATGRGVGMVGTGVAINGLRD